MEFYDCQFQKLLGSIYLFSIEIPDQVELLYVYKQLSKARKLWSGRASFLTAEIETNNVFLASHD